MRHTIFLVFSFFFVSFLRAQTAVELDLLLEAREVNFAQASRFVLVSAGVADETMGAGAAYILAWRQGWLPERASPSASIKLGELCFLIMQAFDMKGSFLYATFSGPHYAFRELNYLKLIPGQRDPDIWVSGERLLQILGMVEAYTGADWTAPEEPPARVAEAPKEAPASAEAAVTEAPKEAPPAPPPAPPKEAPAPAKAVVAEAPKEAPQAPPPAISSPEEVGMVNLGNIQFGPDSAELTAAEKAKLRNMAGILAQYPGAKVLVGGYTARAGNERNRMRISANRAQAVADFLAAQGVCRKEDVIVRAYGALRPLGNNATKEGKAVNRRVEVAIINEGYYTTQFMPNSVKLMETEKAKLRELAAALSRYPDVDLLIAGYTALAGNEQGRRQISIERARVAANFLRSLGVRLPREGSVRAYGAQWPQGDNATKEGKAMNRRVEITLQGGNKR
jgi:outer membrane protein OmpA-like peptidoglycan-associated protein